MTREIPPLPSHLSQISITKECALFIANRYERSFDFVSSALGSKMW